jgi:ATP-dependent DNA helicase RecQ
MMGRDLVRPDTERHGALRMTDAARPILRGEESISLRKDTLHSNNPGPVVKMLVSEEDAPLLSALKAKRRALAEAARVPAYVVFPDKTLIEMAQIRPTDLDGMARITGIGAKKLESYGAAFLAVITGEAPAPQHPQRRRLAGRDAGAIFDRLAEVQLSLQRGPEGIDKPLSCSQATLRQIAEARPSTLSELDRISGMGGARTERFGEAFLAAIAGD